MGISQHVLNGKVERSVNIWTPPTNKGSYLKEQSVRLTNEASIQCHQLHWSAGGGRPRVSPWYPEGSELKGEGMAERE